MFAIVAVIILYAIGILSPTHRGSIETAAVVGDLATKHLLLVDNVLFHGHCISLSDEKMYEEARKEWIDVTTINSASLVNPRGGADF